MYALASNANYRVEITGKDGVSGNNNTNPTLGATVTTDLEDTINSNFTEVTITVKSDDIVGRVKTYEAIVKGENIPEPGVPEGFKVLVKELQSLGLDIKLLSEDNRELELKENIDEGIDFNSIKDDPKIEEELAVVDEDELADGYSEDSEMLLDEEENIDDEDLLLDDEDLLDIDEFNDSEE